MRAGNWDVTAHNGYRGDQIIEGMLQQILGSQGGLDILDAGCGTGLIGQVIMCRARRLDGVDLSDAMLEKARGKNIYNELHREDLVTFMACRANCYDLVICAATLIHFVDLRPAFAATATALRDGGLFIFTVFPNSDGVDDVAVAPLEGLARGGCFVHSKAYIIRMAELTGFIVEQIEQDTHEYNNGDPQTCLTIALRRLSR